jgi:hypothetical protein
VTVSEITETMKDGSVYRSSRLDYHGTIIMTKELATMGRMWPFRSMYWPSRKFGPAIKAGSFDINFRNASNA